MRKLYIGVLNLSVIFFFANCTSTAQNADIIKKYKWMTTSSIAEIPVDLNNRGNASTDLLKQSPPCSWDDHFIFKSNNVFVLEQNMEMCDIVSEPGSWTISNNDTLTIKFSPQHSVKFKILELNNSKMVLVANMPFIPSGVQVTSTFKAID